VVRPAGAQNARSALVRASGASSAMWAMWVT